MTDYPFRIEEKKTAMGTAICVHGPLMSPYLTLYVMQPLNEWATKQINDEWRVREQVLFARWLACAYEAGRRSMAEDIRKMLGIK